MMNNMLSVGVSQDTINYAQEQADLRSISAFRDEWVPYEYLPLPEWLVYIDMGIIISLIVIALFFVLKRKPAKWLNWMAIITFVVLGVIRGGCICPMGLTTNIVMGVFLPFMVSLAGLILFVFPLLAALIGGRVFCTSGCPLGAFQHILPTRKKPYKVPAKINRYIKIAPIIVLSLTIYFGLKGTLYIGCELDPYKPIFFTGKAWFEQGLMAILGNPMEPKILLGFGLVGWIYLIVALVIGYWVERPFCRLLCPYSSVLGLFSIVAWKRRSIDESSCNYCQLCAKNCPTQAITIDKKQGLQKVSNYDCVQCNKCSDRCKTNAL